jgi:hypothetical protein
VDQCRDLRSDGEITDDAASDREGWAGGTTPDGGFAQVRVYLVTGGGGGVS